MPQKDEKKNNEKHSPSNTGQHLDKQKYFENLWICSSRLVGSHWNHFSGFLVSFNVSCERVKSMDFMLLWPHKWFGDLMRMKLIASNGALNFQTILLVCKYLRYIISSHPINTSQIWWMMNKIYAFEFLYTRLKFKDVYFCLNIVEIW